MKFEKTFVRVIIRDEENRVLVVMQKVGRSRIWNLPGGKVEQGESPEVAAKRETLEETGVEIERLAMIFEDSFEFNEQRWTGYFFLAEEYKKAPRNMEPEKFTHVGFEVPDSLRGQCQLALFSDILDLSEHGGIQDYAPQLRLRLWSSSENYSRN